MPAQGGPGITAGHAAALLPVAIQGLGSPNQKAVFCRKAVRCRATRQLAAALTKKCFPSVRREKLVLLERQGS